MGGLQSFVVSTIRQEFRQTAKDIESQKEIINLYDNLNTAMQINAEKMSKRNSNTGTQFMGMLKENEDLKSYIQTS